MIGTWDTRLKFLGAILTSKLPLETLSERNHVPGFDKNSVIFAPDMGKDVSLQLRYVQLDSHVRDNHPRKLRSLVTAFHQDAVVDAAPYAFQKQPNWLSAPANRWHIRHHDSQGSGEVDLFTRKRSIQTEARTAAWKEFIQQTHRRTNTDGSKDSKVVGAYALVWRVSVPASDGDAFVTTDNLHKTQALIGTLDVYAYLSPTDMLYAREPKYTVAVYSYDVDITCAGVTSGDDTVYPFVPDSAGPVELDQFFVH